MDAIKSDVKMVGVVVTTEHRGVFFGYVPLGTVIVDGQVKLTRARNCLYWGDDVRGFVGLAVTGPTKSCRVGPAAPSMVLTDVTSLIETTPEAGSAWEVERWAR